MTGESSGVRPSVLLLSALLVIGCGYAIYEAWSFDPLAGTSEVADSGDANRADRHGHRNGARSSREHTSARVRSAGGTGAHVHHDWGQETDLSRALTLHLPGPTFWRDVRERGLPHDDPQMVAMWRSFHAYYDVDGEAPPLPFEPTAHRAELVDATGDVASSPTSCDVRVLPVTSGPFNCVVRVMCDGRVLYPNERQTAGYVPCEIENGQPVRALDEGFTARDGDPSVDLDLQNGTVRIEEYDAEGQPTYSATLRIQS